MALFGETRTDPTRNPGAFTFGMNTSANPFMYGARHMHAISNEMMEMTMESLQCASQSFQKMRSAKSLEEIFQIEREFVMSSLDGITSHTVKMMEMTTAIPSQISEQASQATQAAAKVVQGGVEVVHDAAKQANEKMR